MSDRPDLLYYSFSEGDDQNRNDDDFGDDVFDLLESMTFLEFYNQDLDNTDPNDSNPKSYDEAVNFSKIDNFSKNGISHATNQALGQGSNDPSLKSPPSQVVNDDIQNLNQVIHQLDPLMIKDPSANSSPNQINTENPPYSYSNFLQNNLAGQIPDSTPSPTQFNYTVNPNFRDDDNSSPTPQEKSSHALKYKNGDEAQKLKKKYVHYNQPYKHCQFFQAIKTKTKDKVKDKVNEIGEKYNKEYEVLISEKKMPNFGRDLKRNLGLSVWFFQDLMPYIYPWIYEKINEI